jgi:hypothetical protein
MLFRGYGALLSALVVSVSVGLTACGGGGGDDGGPAAAQSAITVSIPAAPLAIVDTNAEAVAAEALSSSAGDVAGSVPVLFNASGATAQAGAWSPQTAARFATQRLQAKPIATDGAVTNAVQSCSGGGEVDVIDNGTSGSITFRSCIEGGTTINGSVFASNIVDTPTQQSITLEFKGFSISDATGYLAIHGDISMSISVDGAGVQTQTLSGGSFASQFNSEAFQLTNYNLTAVVDPGAGTTTETSNFTYSSTSMGGSVTVQTIVPFVTNVGDLYPSSGQFVATGSNGSKCRLTALNSVDVLLEVDADGMDGYETMINTTWAALDSAS